MPGRAVRRGEPSRSTVRLGLLGRPAGFRGGPEDDGEGERSTDGGPVVQPTSGFAGARWVAPVLRGARVAVDVRAAVAVVLVAVAGLGATGWYAWQAATASGPALPVGSASVLRTSGSPPASGALAASTPSPSLAPAAAAALVVDVAGRVRRPGLVHLPPGSRVADALVAVGGALPGVDLTALNLARPVTDGEQVVVGPTPPAAGVVGGAGGPGSAGSAGPSSAADGGAAVDLNTASLDQLEQLPGLGPVLAQRVLDWRTAHGRFSSVDELREVGGIGPKKYADLAPRVTV
jgi:competence protein ComEA